MHSCQIGVFRKRDREKVPNGSLDYLLVIRDTQEVTTPNEEDEMSEPTHRTEQRLSKLLPFSEDAYVRLAVQMADAFASREGLHPFSETSTGCSFTVAPSPFTDDVVVVIVHTRHFADGAAPLEVQTSLGNVDVLTSGSVTASDFRVCFYPFLNVPADRCTSFVFPSVEIAAEVDSYLAFAEDKVAAQASVLAAFHEAWFTYSGSTEFSATPLVSSQRARDIAWPHTPQLSTELLSLPIGSIAVQVPLMDDVVEEFMDFLVKRPYLNLRFSRVANPARADDGFRQVGNILLLHALPF